MVDHGGFARRSWRARLRGDGVPDRRDLTLAGASLVLGTLDEAFGPARGIVDNAGLAVAINAALSAVVVFRRRAPLTVASAAVVLHALSQVFWPFVLALFTVGTETASRRRVLVVSALAVVAFLQPWQIGEDELRPSYFTAALAVVIGPVAFGRYVRARRELVVGLLERTQRLEQEQNLLTEQALLQERARIAREMHDVVGHRMSLVVLHAGALALVTERNPARIAEVAELIRESAQKALEELRHTVTMLTRRSEQAMASGPGANVADLEALVAQSRAAGLPVSLHVEGTWRPVAGTVERAAYRVVQEALTNVHRHAPGARTAVVVRLLPDAIEVIVINEGIRTSPSRHTEFARGGHGLVGLRERVALLGGDFRAEPLPSGGFRVVAILPVPRPAAKQPEPPESPEQSGDST